MIGYLIDGKWIQPQAIECVEYLQLAGQQWVPVPSLEAWNKLPETQRAFQIRTASGKDVLCERPQAIDQVDIRGLMATKAETTAAGAAAPVNRPDLAPMPGAGKNPNLVGEGKIMLP